MIAQAQSGTGKTATFLLAMLSRVDIDLERCQCLCMAPTRELAVQIASVGREMSRFIPKITFSLAIREETRKYTLSCSYLLPFPTLLYCFSFTNLTANSVYNRPNYFVFAIGSGKICMLTFILDRTAFR